MRTRTTESRVRCFDKGNLSFGPALYGVRSFGCREYARSRGESGRVRGVRFASTIPCDELFSHTQGENMMGALSAYLIIAFARNRHQVSKTSWNGKECREAVVFFC